MFKEIILIKLLWKMIIRELQIGEIYLLRKFLSQKKRINLKETNIYLTKKENCKKILDLIINELNHLLKINRDPMSVDDNLRMINNTKNMNYFFNHAKFLDDESDNETLKKYRSFHVLIDAIIKNEQLSDKQKEDLLGRWYIHL